MKTSNHNFNKTNQPAEKKKMNAISSTILLSPLAIFFLLCLLLDSLPHGANGDTLGFLINRTGLLNTTCNNGHLHDKHMPPLIQNPRTILTVPAATDQLLTFADARLAVVYPVIQKFKSIITSDPLGITQSWVGSDICRYRGFYCESPPDNQSAMAVASVDFNGFQLSAPTLDGFLDQLLDIALFHANSNNFSGTLSPNIANLPYLYELDISNNQFSGPFPTAVLGMNGLTFLDIRFNFFTGSVPGEIFMQNLQVLFINNNNFMQILADNIANTHIIFLTLANNNFKGPIPSAILKAMSSLTEVLLLNDQLSGCLPYEIGFLQEARVLDVGNNRLTGELPFSVSCIQKAEQLNLGGNLLYGMVPELVCALPNLVNLSLSENYFIQVGPLCRALMAKGVVDVRNNCIPDIPFQRSTVECANFYGRPRPCSSMWSYIIPCKRSRFQYPWGSAAANGKKMMASSSSP